MTREKLHSYESFDETPTERSYGECLLHARSPIVFLAPHGIDDRHTADIARALAEKFDAAYIVNTNFARVFRPGMDPGKIEDFNRPNFPSVNGKSFLDAETWYREFLDDYHRLSRLLLMQYPDARPVIFHIHGMKDRGDSLLDIGIGMGELVSWDIQDRAKNLASAILSINPKSGSHITARVPEVESLRNSLISNAQRILAADSTVGIGKYHSASEPDRLSQLGAHLGRHIDEIQLEISASLREDHQRKACIEILSESIRQIYFLSEV